MDKNFFDFSLEPGKELKEKMEYMDKEPIVSVVIPFYNDKRYIRQSVNAILNQTFPYYELLIIDDGSKDEMYFENRIVYHALKRFRLSASVFFKFSTAVDGKTIDKTNIPKMLASILQEYEAEYRQWRLGHVGKIWNRSGDS